MFYFGLVIVVKTCNFRLRASEVIQSIRLLIREINIYSIL
jgi:hypothetical protein